MIIGGIFFDSIGDEAIIDRMSYPQRYDSSYIDHYLQLSDTATGKKLLAFRRGYIEAFANDGLIMDYGCGCGCLLDGERIFGYDINPFCRKYIERGFDPKPQLHRYSTICFFDSFEHLSNVEDVVSEIAHGTCVIMSIPVWSGWDNMLDIVMWKHWKPEEHNLYVSQQGLISMMNDFGFTVVDMNHIETSIGREDILTFCFTKEG